jgi:hypothetical protein
MIEALTTGRMIASWINSTLEVVKGYHPPSSQFYYHWVDTTVSVLLVHEGIIRPAVSTDYWVNNSLVDQ